MTNKEARKVLQEIWRNERTDYDSVEVKEAIDRAIRTLGERSQASISYLHQDSITKSDTRL